MTVISADWVLPVEGVPVERGAVVIEEGRVAAVGPADELGAGEHFAEAAIVPGFVNAHTHLEYAVYAGFGDGLSFGPWITTHIQRKQLPVRRGRTARNGPDSRKSLPVAFAHVRRCAKDRQSR